MLPGLLWPWLLELLGLLELLLEELELLIVGMPDAEGLPDDVLGMLGEELEELEEDGLGMLGADELGELDELGMLGIEEDDEDELEELWQPPIVTADTATSIGVMCLYFFFNLKCVFPSVTILGFLLRLA